MKPRTKQNFDQKLKSLNSVISNVFSHMFVFKPLCQDQNGEARIKWIYNILLQTRLYLERSGVTQDMLNTLKVIHVRLDISYTYSGIQ